MSYSDEMTLALADASPDLTSDTAVRRTALFATPIGVIPRRPAVRIRSRTMVADAIAIMRETELGCVVVQDGGQYRGLVSERDILLRVAGAAHDPRTTPVASILPAEPGGLRDDTTLGFALVGLSTPGIRYAAVVDGNGRPLGVLGLRDVLFWLLPRLVREPAPLQFTGRGPALAESRAISSSASRSNA